MRLVQDQRIEVDLQEKLLTFVLISLIRIKVYTLSFPEHIYLPQSALRFGKYIFYKIGTRFCKTGTRFSQNTIFTRNLNDFYNNKFR